MPKVIIITGTPGVGKSTVARRLAREKNYEHLDISQLVQNEKLHRRFDAKRKTLVVNPIRLKRRLRQILQTRLTDGVVVTTHYLDGLVPSGMVRRVFVLRLNPAKLEERLRRRHWDPGKVEENVEAELIGVCLTEALEQFGKTKVHEIDTTNKSIVGVVREMTRFVGTSSGRNRVKGVVGIVDWLESFNPGPGRMR